MFRAISSIVAFFVFAAAPCSIAHSVTHPLTIDDVLDITRIDQATISPDGEWVAVVLQRPARIGEVYGRVAYEVDPARSDVWLVSLRTGERRNLTLGSESASGFWCATWSPDGAKLAMLSTRPEGGEPRGGDNVRLYVWDRAGGALTRLSEAAVMTQTRYGSPLYQVDLRVGSEGESPRRCGDEENAPFAWLDNRRLLAAMLPAGGISGLIDEFARPDRHVQETSRALREGSAPTHSAVGSGAERLLFSDRTHSVELRTFDTSNGASTTIADVPVYPFRGALTISVAPGAHQAAILATVGGIPPSQGQRIPNQDETWLAEKRLGFLDLRNGGQVRWVTMPPEARYPLELFGWSPDGRRVTLRARDRFDAATTPLFVAAASDLSVRQVGREAMSIGGPVAGVGYPRDNPVFWIDNRSLLARVDPAIPVAGAGSATRADWWRLTLEGQAVNVTSAIAQAPASLRRSSDGMFFTLANGNIAILDVARRRLLMRSAPLASQNPSIAWPREPRATAPDVVIRTNPPDGGTAYQLAPLRGASGVSASFTLPQNAELLDFNRAAGIVVSSERSESGQYLRATFLRDDSRRDLLSANTHLAEVAWGERRLIEYRGQDGQQLNAAVILPPAYSSERRYPVITWVYPGYVVRGLQTYFLDHYLPGIYNLQLYAAHGYVVLIPSIRYARAADGETPDFSTDVLAAVDRLVELGIADSQRIGLMGQSFGGFGTYALVTRTNRFRAAIAIAGITDFAAYYGEFDRAARGYPGIEHEKSFNWIIAELGQSRLGSPPHEERARYSRDSPLTHVDRVETPLLMIHGEYDKRASMSQAESFFFNLYRQGKTARLLRYWGESHSLSQSPANVRSIYQEILTWFGRYLGPGEAPAASD